MKSMSFKLLIFLIAFCLMAACGYKGPPLAPEDEPLEKTGTQKLSFHIVVMTPSQDYKYLI